MTQTCIDAEERPFGQAALDLRRKGLAVIPCSGSGGKSPEGAVSGFHKWRHAPSEETILQFSKKWGCANVGAITGPLSGVTVVDVDDGPERVAHMCHLFGDTPLITGTPSGGRHLWYRHDGEPNANLRTRYGWKVDVKATSGVVIVPPSRNLKTGIPYTFERGSFDDLPDLPPMRAEGRNLLLQNSRRPVEALADTPQHDESLTSGQRNRVLFSRGLRLAARCADPVELYGLLVRENSKATCPLPATEVYSIATSVWGYQERGENWIGGPARAQVTEALLKMLASCSFASEALWLYCRLRLAHGRKPATDLFAIAAEPMARGPSMPLSARSIRRAILVLEEHGLIARIRQGGRGPRDPALFAFEPVETGVGVEE